MGTTVALSLLKDIVLIKSQARCRHIVLSTKCKVIVEISFFKLMCEISEKPANKFNDVCEVPKPD